MQKACNAKDSAVDTRQGEGGINGLIAKIGRFMSRHVGVLTLVLIFVLIMSSKVYATAPPTDPAEVLWETIRDLIGKWVLRLGGVVLFIGLIMFGLGWKNEDAEGRSRGVQTIIAGAIVMAAGGMVALFFA